MRNLNESIEGLNQHYLELLKRLNRVLDINIEMLEKQKYTSRSAHRAEIAQFRPEDDDSRSQRHRDTRRRARHLRGSRTR